MDVIIEPGWKETLKQEFEKPYFAKIVEFLNKEDLTGMKIYPPEDMMYNAFNCTNTKPPSCTSSYGRGW